MFKFFPGIFFIQLVTTGLAMAAFKWLHNFEIVIVIIFLGLIFGVLSAFWFASFARDMQKDALMRMNEAHSRDRENILVKAEQEKANIQTESYKHIELETRRVNTRANFKVGAAFAAAAGIGGVMIVTQFVTLGLMMLVGSGSGLVGYLARMKHERATRIANITSEIADQTRPQRIPLLDKIKK